MMKSDEDDIGQFTDNGLADDGAKTIAEVLKINTRVWHLNLSGEKKEKENTEKRDST